MAWVPRPEERPTTSSIVRSGHQPCYPSRSSNAALTIACPARSRPIPQHPCTNAQQGYQPAVPGTMRHIPAELIASNPSGIATWQAAGFVVDVGEIDLAQYRQRKTVH